MRFVMENMTDIRLILDNIRSTHNVGSIFRTADAAGVSKIYCIGTTPAPVDRFGRKRKDISKVALGAEETVAWESVVGAKETGVLVKKLKKEGFTIVALEQDARSVDYRSIFSENEKGETNKKKQNNILKVLIILGNEVGGVSKELLALSDMIAEIPMRGEKESLNVSVAAGVVLFSLGA